jgi:hypothetical protein
MIQRANDSQAMLDALELIENRWMPGDIVFHVGDGSWVEMINYTTFPASHWKMPPCGVVRGGLSPETRDGLGMQIAPLYEIDWRRAWIITAESPMTPDCEQEIIDRTITGLRPVTCMLNDVIKQSCLYLVER